MTGVKRTRLDVEAADDANVPDSAPSTTSASSHAPEASSSSPPPAKRRRQSHEPAPTPTTADLTPPTRRPAPPRRDRLSRLSDELLLRILSFLSLPHLLAVSPVSRRFYALASDSQLWKALYYARFVLPRAMRIPGFRDGLGGAGAGAGSGFGSGNGSGGAGHKLHYAGRRTLWADGRWGGVVQRDRDVDGGGEKGWAGGTGEDKGEPHRPVNWKRQFKIRYNWARGKCAVEELKLGEESDVGEGEGRKMLVKVVEGVAVTADRVEGLRAWDLKSRSLVAQIGITDGDSDAAPSCIAVDEAEFDQGVLQIALGFENGSFGVWRLFTNQKRLEQRYRHEKSSNGELIAMALSYPYLLTATQAVLVSLYTFDVPSAETTGPEVRKTDQRSESGADGKSADGPEKLSAPYLLTSLDSHTSRPPLALSIRKAGKTTVASVAYTFSTRRGWSIGIQDLHIHQPSTYVRSAPEIATTRIAYTTPVEMDGLPRAPLTPPATPRRGHPLTATTNPSSTTSTFPNPTTTSSLEVEAPEPGPTTLCYTHPYLLATLPDNTLVLHLCTSTAAALRLSDGIRLWGHTSGVGDAEITARGKAVSVSARGEEMRVWELEGGASRAAGMGTAGAGVGGSGAGGRSVEIRPWQAGGGGGDDGGLRLDQGDPARDWDERRNWVGFDDEMVIVLKERKGARESLMVYDFT